MVEGDRQLTVICFLWRGWRPLYDARHVNALGRMLEEHLHVPYRFLCVTTEPEGIDYETYPGWDDPIVTKLPTHHNSFRRLKLFSSWAAEEFGGWILMLDLDCMIVDDITPLISWDDFRIQKNGVCHYNGSMWLHRTGSRTDVWDSFDPIESPKIIARQRTRNGRQWKGSDQGWISYVYGDGQRLYTTDDGVYRWTMGAQRIARRDGGLPGNARIIFFPGLQVRKPWSEEFRQVFPRIHKRYASYLA